MCNFKIRKYDSNGLEDLEGLEDLRDVTVMDVECHKRRGIY